MVSGFFWVASIITASINRSLVYAFHSFMWVCFVGGVVRLGLGKRLLAVLMLWHEETKMRIGLGAGCGSCCSRKPDGSASSTHDAGSVPGCYSGIMPKRELPATNADGDAVPIELTTV